MVDNRPVPIRKIVMPLNEKQTRFAHAYIACGGNGRAAAVQAGYSHSSAAKRA
ncbi:MAG: hypothetical protein CL566_09555 [Alphaproteobacteria bacterium]|nr:hypothetical protein [Alphaproteobacteria bacterium]